MPKDIIDIILRSIISVLVLFILTRLMGKKQIAQLNFFDYVVGISIGSISANFAVDENISYIHGLIAILTYGLIPIIVSYISVRSLWARKIVEGTPTILIQNGKILEDNLKKSKVTLNDVLEECRLNGIFDISTVEFAILETSGKVSIELKSENQPLTPSDMNIPVNYNGLCANLIIDGKIIIETLELVNRSKSWLLKELKKKNIYSHEEVLLASMNSDGKLHIDLKDKDPKPFKVI
ncbi:DUF421 domain-containing protein [Hathewaya histolytica]|uniref:DUF421 domain-containing protein n=1 Tax=Hathewaya histolytica TaxID=1498 RepID=UPI003B66FB74